MYLRAFTVPGAFAEIIPQSNTISGKQYTNFAGINEQTGSKGKVSKNKHLIMGIQELFDAIIILPSGTFQKLNAKRRIMGQY